MTDSFENVLRDLQTQLGRAENLTAADATPVELPPVETTVSSTDELVSVTMKGNEFTRLTIDARAMRRSNQELADDLLTVFNAALKAQSEALTAALAAENQTDFSALRLDVQKLQAQSIEAMRTYTDSLFGALDQARRLNG